MKVVWSRRAIRHLEHAREFIAKDNPKAAGELALRILDAVELLSTQPNMGRAGRIPGTRELVVPGTPYLIPYRVRGERIELIAVFHGLALARSSLTELQFNFLQFRLGRRNRV